MRITDYIKKVFRFGLRAQEDRDVWGFPLHDESRPHMHVVGEGGKRSIEYLSEASRAELERDVYAVLDRARAAGL